MNNSLPMRSMLCGLLVLTGLACGGGTTVDPVAHLEPLCETSWEPAPNTALARVDVPASDLPKAPWVTVGSELRLDNKLVAVAELADELSAANEMATVLGTEPGEVLLRLEATVPLAQVQAVGEVLSAGGATKQRLAVATNEPWPRPAYPDPVFAEAFQARLADASPDIRAQLGAVEIASLIVACPGAQRAFEAVAHASPDMKCVLMAHGLAEALPSCPFTDGDAVVTAFQVLTQPASETQSGLLAATLDPKGTPMVVPADATWGVIAPLLKAQRGGVWPVAEGT